MFKFIVKNYYEKCCRKLVEKQRVEGLKNLKDSHSIDELK